MDRVPPYAESAEKALLGCFLLDPVRIGDAVSSGMVADWFYDDRHRVIHGVLLEMWDERVPIDLVTVGERLEAKWSTQDAGGIAYVASMPDETPSAANTDYYVEILKDKYRRRKLLHAAQQAAEAVFGPDDAEKLLDRAESEILSIRTEHSGEHDMSSKQLAHHAIDLLEDRCSGKQDAISSGWMSMDQTFRGGLRPGNVFVVAGRPGTGKTAFTLSLLASMARSGIPVGFISLEMSGEEVGTRLLSIESEVDIGSFNAHHSPDEQQRIKVIKASARIAKMPLFVNDKPYATPQTVAARARRWSRRHGIKVLAIDYLQLMSSQKGKDRREQVDEASRAIKLLAKELKIPIILLCQLNRDIEKDPGRKPRLSDLRESGAIEQDADIIGMLYQPDAQQQERSGDEPLSISLLVAKQRAGRANVDVKFTFRPNLTRFDPWSPIADYQ